ncbi:hypothetical protein BgiBS90_024104 [Biomphalaria glabrata]|nr:hypothetical protein BgiBS90_024104 [Biomphalaria glabrata]
MSPRCRVSRSNFCSFLPPRAKTVEELVDSGAQIGGDFPEPINGILLTKALKKLGKKNGSLCTQHRVEGTALASRTQIRNGCAFRISLRHPRPTTIPIR